METSDKLKLRRIPQNNWTEFFKKVKVMKDKEKKKKVRNCAWLKETKEREFKHHKGHYNI